VTSFIYVLEIWECVPSGLLSFIVKVTQPDNIDTRILIVDTRIGILYYCIICLLCYIGSDYTIEILISFSFEIFQPRTIFHNFC